MKALIKKALKFAGYPVYRYFGPRFHGIHERMDRVDANLADLRGLIVEMDRRLGEFERRISTDIETTIEVLLTHQRSTIQLRDRLNELKRMLAQVPARIGTGEDLASER